MDYQFKTSGVSNKQKQNTNVLFFMATHFNQRSKISLVYRFYAVFINLSKHKVLKTFCYIGGCLGNFF